MDDTTYEAPTIREIGSLAELTQQSLNKVGASSDLLTGLTNGIVVGSFVPV